MNGQGLAHHRLGVRVLRQREEGDAEVREGVADPDVPRGQQLPLEGERPPLALLMADVEGASPSGEESSPEYTFDDDGGVEPGELETGNRS